MGVSAGSAAADEITGKTAQIISNGAFYLKEWVPGAHILLAKNPNYRDADAIKLDGIKFYLIEDANASYTAYLNGEILFIKDVPTEEIPKLSESSDFHIEPIIATYYVSFNTHRALLDNVLVRKALNLAVDREYLSSVLLQGTYSPAVNFVGPGWKDTDGNEFIKNTGKDHLPMTADIEGAMKCLEEAGCPGGKGLPVLRYSTNDSGYNKGIAEYLQYAWKQIGVTLEIEILEAQSFIPARRNGDYDIARNGWTGDYADQSNILNEFYSSNCSVYSDPDFDAAIDRAQTTTDTAERSAALHEAEDIMMSDYACMPLAYNQDFWLQS